MRWRPVWGSGMAKLRISPEAQADLKDIRAYVENESGDHETAMKLIAGITRRIRLLQEQPQMGAPLTAQVRIITDYRYLVCGRYYAFYKCGADSVEVIRILHCSRNYVRILFGISEHGTDEE